MTLTKTTLITTPVAQLKGGDLVFLNNHIHEVFDVIPGFGVSLLLKTINPDGAILQTRLPRDASVDRVVS